MRRCVADSGYFLALAAGFWGTPASPPNSPWRTMRTGAWPRRQPKLCRINLCRWRGRFLASHPEDHGDRRDRRGGHPARGGSSGPIRVWRTPLLRCGK